MKRKGFTLIELLAVIVILAIIALIATPMILGVIETARKESAESSALGYLDAVEKQIMINQLDTTKTQITDGVYDLPMTDISVKGEQPSEGWIVVEKSQITNYSMKVMDYIITKDSDATKEGEVATKPSGEKPEVSYLCKRADVTTLHTEECTQTSNYCYAAGYTSANKGTTIKYGNETTEEGKLNSGDAFDCDVNGDGNYDPTTERFYYVSGLNGDNTSDVKVLIYYNNTSVGEDGKIKPDNTSNSLIAYYPSVDENWHGPIEAIKNLPTVNDWTNVSLSNTSRNITNESGATTTSNGSKTIENPFIYKNANNIDYAARLLTYKEVATACGTGTENSTGYLDPCNYLMENTKYSASSMGTYGYWLETPRGANPSYAWYVHGYNRYVLNNSVSHASYCGVRPAIEVLESDISY